MADSPTSEFARNIPTLISFESIVDFQRYRPLPDGWFLALADVVGSTRAIEVGNYKAVNMAGVSVISALLNAAGDQSYPFAFGGDGALVALPGELDTTAYEILAMLRTWVSEALELELRAAVVPMSDVLAAGFEVRVGRYRASESVSYAMFVGGGTSWAEAEMKAGRYGVARAPPGSRPDLTGLSCRWDPIPATNGEIVSLLVIPGATGPTRDFQHLVSQIIGIVGSENRGAHPLPGTGPPITLTTKGIDYETRASAKDGEIVRRKISLFVETAIAVLLDRIGVKVGTFDARAYRAEVTKNSDFRKFDDGLKMTIDIPEEKVRLLEGALDAAAASGICKFGLHRQAAALMTCFVPSMSARDHIHFIDGAGGGYAMAALNLKGRFDEAIQNPKE